jgi:hypothetical protein
VIFSLCNSFLTDIFVNLPHYAVAVIQGIRQSKIPLSDLNRAFVSLFQQTSHINDDNAPVTSNSTEITVQLR